MNKSGAAVGFLLGAAVSFIILFLLSFWVRHILEVGHAYKNTPENKMKALKISAGVCGGLALLAGIFTAVDKGRQE